MEIQKKLFSLQDEAYGDFSGKLMPTIDRERIIGVRMPQLRALAMELRGSNAAMGFLADLPHEYYEENNLHALLLEGVKEYETLLAELTIFLPFVDNWATCDCMSMKLLGKHPQKTLQRIRIWLKSTHCYTVRFAIGLLMRYYLEDNFREEYLHLAAKACCGEYYINMMVAWYFATALCKQYDAAVAFLEQNRLPQWVHNKTIQKAVESYRITPEQKAYLKTLRRKENN